MTVHGVAAKPGRRFLVAPAALMRSAGDETVILHQSTEQFYGLNRVGARIVALLSERRTFEELIDQIVSEYAVEREIASADISDLLDTLTESQLVEFTD